MRGCAAVVAQAIGGLISFGSVVWALILEGRFVLNHWGVIGLVLSVFISPIAVVAIPLYAGFRYGYWLPGLLTLGGMVVGGFFSLLGEGLED